MNFDSFSKWKKRVLIIAIDLGMTLGAALITGLTDAYSMIEKLQTQDILRILCIHVSCYFFCGLYRGVWRFASIPDLIRIIKAVILSTITTLIYLKMNHLDIPFNIYFIYSLLLFTLISGPRLLYRWLRDYRHFFTAGKRVLIVGAGSGGEGIIRDLCRFENQYKPLVLVDDDLAKQGCEIHGVRVMGACKDIPKLVEKHAIDFILIAIPSAPSKRMREIVSYCEASKAPFRTLPSLKDITDGKVSINALREVLLEDLLGREAVNLNWMSIRTALTGKKILVTGGGGSIGSELCRQISELFPSDLIIVDNNEFNLYQIDLELQKKLPSHSLHTHLCNITDQVEMNKIFNTHQPDYVFHVAAYKHVPLLENHLRVSMFNNIIGTRIVADLAHLSKVKTFILISTDKAVNPTNVMGATKRASEVYCQNLNLHSNTAFITVRFGNVLNSTGSVLPLFRKQLQSGGPITLTHPDITRYFMTIPEASQLILQTVSMTQDGEIFVLDMGEPINIKYLAEQMVKLSGKVIGKDVEISYIGLRPGEKLHEELFHPEEVIGRTSHPKIKQAKVRYFDWDRLHFLLREIETACEVDDEPKLRNLLHHIVPEYGAPITAFIPMENYAYST